MTAVFARSSLGCAHRWRPANPRRPAVQAPEPKRGGVFLMEIRAEEITKIIRQELAGFTAGVDVSEVGTVLSVGDGIARIHGLEKAMAGELLALPHGVMAIALNLEEDSVGAVLMGEFSEIKEGDEVKRTRRIMSVPV